MAVLDSPAAYMPTMSSLSRWPCRDRRARRRQGKSDSVDAEVVARATLAGTAITRPRAGEAATTVESVGTDCGV